MTADQVDAVEILTWLHLHDQGPPDWVTGGLIVAAAAVAALTTLFSTSPTDLPLLGGADELRDLNDDLRALERLQKLSLINTREDKKLVWRERHLGYLSKRVTAARRALWMRGIPIFLVVGPLIAAAVATTIWQALIIGATGPAAWRALSLRRRTRDLAHEAGPRLEEMIDESGSLLSQLEAAYWALDLTRTSATPGSGVAND
jgi:hypothetical protein